MFDLGFQELIVIFIVALIVFGPQRLPELGRTIGKGINELKKAMGSVKYEVDRELYDARRAVKKDEKGDAGPDKKADRRDGADAA